MPRDIPVGNGNMLIAFDKDYHMRELFYPYVGEDNHTSGSSSMMGIWCDGRFSWIDSSWNPRMTYLGDSLVTEVSMERSDFDVEIVSNDCIDFHENIYIKKVRVRNKRDREVDARLFFSLDLNILGNPIGDTALYRPDRKVVALYKKDRWFIVDLVIDGVHGIEEYSIGTKGYNGLEGTYMDAVDGVLEKNPIQQGTIDSVVGANLKLKPHEERTLYYYIGAGKTWEDVCIHHSIVKEKTPESLIVRTKNYWELWCKKEDLPLDKLPERLSWLYKKSLLILRTQIDNRGGILAANDSDVMQYNRDTYSYVWPRDGALVAHALDRAGYGVLSGRFFDFCSRVICGEGYFSHKYTASENIGSSWHPYIADGKRQFPIQEDETSLVVWALWEHFKRYRKVEELKPLYKRIVKNAANFMCSFIDEKTGLPKESYDLWEERLGVHTFTVASTYAGLMAAYKFAKLFGEIEDANRYKSRATRMKEAFIEHMYLKDEGYFARLVRIDDGKIVGVDKNIDASMYSIFAFGMFDPKDTLVKSSMEAVINRLWVRTPIGGIARYIDDPYYRISSETPGNPWFITTMWVGYYYIEIGEQEKALEVLNWVANRTLESGVLSEQVDPYTNAPLSVSPLTWSHATYIETINRYIEKFV